MVINIKSKLTFINISAEDLTLFEWKPPKSLKSYILDLKVIRDNTVLRENTANEIFFHINKGNMKIVYMKKLNLIYSIGADKDIQFQILESFLEYIDEKFHEMYDIDVILSYGNISSNIFDHFKEVINDSVNNFNGLDLIEIVHVRCRVCKEIIPLYIKKSIMKNETSFPIPIVYNHKGHAIICYIDQDFVVRGVEIANITG